MALLSKGDHFCADEHNGLVIGVAVEVFPRIARSARLLGKFIVERAGGVATRCSLSLTRY